MNDVGTATAVAEASAPRMSKGGTDGCGPAASTDATEIPTGNTPETSTTPSRSLSPSSDGGASLMLPQRGAAVRGSGSGSPGGPSGVVGEAEGEGGGSGSAGSSTGEADVAAAAEARSRACHRLLAAVSAEAALPAKAAAGVAVVAAKAAAEAVAAACTNGSGESGSGAGAGNDAERAADDAQAGDGAKGVGAGKSARPLLPPTPGAMPGTELEATAAAEVPEGVEAVAPAAMARSKEGSAGASVGEAGAAGQNGGAGAVGVGGAKGSRAKAPGRSGQGAAGGHVAGGIAASSQACGEQLQAQMQLAPAFALLPPMPTLGPTMNSFSDRRIIEVLAAPEATHRRLLRTARRVPEILADPLEHALVSCTELYGSLSLDMSEPNALRPWKQDWASYYVNGRSDVDFVVQTRHKVAPSAVAQRLLKKGPWRMIGQVQVHKFASTQFTLLGSFEEEDGGGQPAEVYLDITCIEQKLHFNRFKSRQEAFRKVFMEVRSCIEGQFAAQGALAFDAYIHLLKAFAAKVPGNGLTGFQATCIGLFTLQIGHFRMKPTQSIALSLFEGFLRFCVSFYSDMMRPADLCWHSLSYRQCAIDLSVGGRWLPRMSTSWHSELYFMAEEVKMHTRPDERMNITHSLDPARVSVEALALLNRAFFSSPAGAAARVNCNAVAAAASGT